MAQVLPGRLGRLQEAETRRLELEEAKRQEILEKAEKKKHEADLARQAREAADLQREAEAMERATSLRTRWDQADRRAAKEKKAVQRAASARISKWEKRRDKATLGLCPETLFDRLRRQMEEDGLVPKPEEPAAVKKAPPRTRKPWSRPSSARVMPKPPQELQSPRGLSTAVRARYDGQEDLAIIQRRLAEVQAAAREAARQAAWAAKEELVQQVRWMLMTRQLRRGWDKLKYLASIAKKTRLVTQAVRRMLNQKLIRCWNSWADVAFENVHRFSAMEQVARAFLNRRLKRGWLDTGLAILCNVIPE